MKAKKSSSPESAPASSALPTSSATSSGVVDAIAAEDIGKFPDTNIAESLQRIPGVSIDRVNGEGSKVTVRGFGPQFNLITLNGRQLATSSVGVVGGDQDVENQQPTSRSFDFSNLSSEGVRTLEVYKTAKSALPSGGIGATINVRTQRPLETSESGLRGSIGAKALYDTSNDGFKVTPEVSGVVAWSNEADTFRRDAVRRLSEARGRGSERDVERLEYPDVRGLHQSQQRLCSRGQSGNAGRQ